VNPKTRNILLYIEFTTLFILIPLALFLSASRMGIYLALWGAGLYGFWVLRSTPSFSWHTLWHGKGWSKEGRRNAFLRFLFLATLLALITYQILPERFMRFPLDRFALWYAVMILYPILSIVPQEIFFRSFYFARYEGWLTEKTSGMLINGLLFGFCHIVLNNWIAPTFCAIAGVLFAHSYQQHRSLKWSVIEHSLYGCWVFTVGIGWYFFTGNWRH